MNRLKISKSNKILGVILSIFFIYLTIRLKNYSYEVEFYIPQKEANEVWEFVADFANMKLLNPTLIDFSIVHESGNYDHWKYTVQYLENLSHWPYFQNEAEGQFNVKIEKKNLYLIESTHKTYFFRKLFSVDSQSVFQFKNHENSVHCVEIIIYECPAILSYFCAREVAFQRDAIKDNLIYHFKNLS